MLRVLGVADWANDEGDMPAGGASAGNPSLIRRSELLRVVSSRPNVIPGMTGNTADETVNVEMRS